MKIRVLCTALLTLSGQGVGRWRGESIGNWGLTATTANWVSGYRKEVIEARHPSET